MKSHTSEALLNFIILMISGLGLSMEPPQFIGGLLMAVAGSMLTRLFMEDQSRKSVGVTLLAGVFFGIVAALINQRWPILPPNLAMALGGLGAVLILPWLLKRLPIIADRAVDKVLPGGEK